MRPKYDDKRLRRIFDKTNGNCHLCCVKLAFSNYGISGKRGSWHVEHSRPVAKGGSHHLNNLFAAHIDCNLEKSTITTRTVRGWNGRSRAPLNKVKYEAAKVENTVLGGTLGAGIGALFGGPPGALLGGAIGALFGNDVDPNSP